MRAVKDRLEVGSRSVLWDSVELQVGRGIWDILHEGVWTRVRARFQMLVEGTGFTVGDNLTGGKFSDTARRIVYGR